MKRLGHWKQLRNELRAERFDLVLDPQGLSKSSLLGWLSGARCRMGFDYSHGREIAPLLATHRIKRKTRHMVDTYLQLLDPWSSEEVGNGRFKMPTYSKAAQSAEQMLSELDLGNQLWVGINPGAGWTTRIWPPTRFGMVARELRRRVGVRSLIFWGSESEQLLAKAIEENSEGAAKVIPQTDLKELVELIRRTSLLLTGDTGPLHMASAVGTRCVSLHGPTWSDESGPYSNPNISIQSPLSLTSGKKLVRKGPNTAMQAIEVDEVVDACCNLLGHKQMRAA